ncbi:hypothetical protein KBB74_01835 [Candidatus Parcubacteria bacterium]|nr:hypothetical protein [Candidatus Parcubacteria bacterium]
MRKYILLLIILLSLFQVTYAAMEVAYPEIGDYTITEDSEFIDYVAYGVMMLIAIAIVLVVMVMIWAGINFIVAGGDPGKVSQAKEMMVNALVGVTLLLSFYWILDTINPDIIDKPGNPKIDPCSMGGIIVTINNGTEDIITCFNQSISKIQGDIIGAKWDFEEGQVKEVWAFPDEDYKGGGTPIFQTAIGVNCCDKGTLTKGTSLIPAFPALAGAKSIYIIDRKIGFYFYDEEDFGVNKELPFYTLKSIKNINETDRPTFDNKASSFSVVCPESGGVCNMKYKAVIFENANYSGECSFLGAPYSSSLITPDVATDKTVNYKGNYIGNKKMSSVVVYKENQDGVDQGRIILYNSLGCNEGDSEYHSKCPIEISKYSSTRINMRTLESVPAGDFPTEGGCPDWDPDSYIQSIRIPDGKGAVVVVGTNGTCAYFDITSVTQGGTCVGDLRGTGVYEGGSWLFGTRPEEVIVLPTN